MGVSTSTHSMLELVPGSVVTATDMGLEDWGVASSMDSGLDIMNLRERERERGREREGGREGGRREGERGRGREGEREGRRERCTWLANITHTMLSDSRLTPGPCPDSAT